MQSLSLNAGEEMANSPLYNIFRHAFLVLGNVAEGETEGSFDGHPIEQYGDTLVFDLISLDAPNNIETEAALVTSVWMACAHELFQVLTECRAQDQVKGMAALDKAVALWVGADQVPGSNDEGQLLYALAESAGERFGQDDGVSMINQELMEKFTSIQSSFAQQCSSDNAAGYGDLRKTIRRMIGLMTVPLVQNFIHYSQRVQIIGAPSSYVELYALATIPRVAACDPDAYDKELHLSVLGDLKPSEVPAVIEAIQQSYHCWEITCADVGSYLGGALPQCEDTSAVTMAGYSTDRSSPLGLSSLDRDILAIDIFLRFSSYGAAEDWYMHGWSSDVTLRSLAKNQLVPALKDGNSYIDTFQEYYQDIDFADNMVINAIGQVPPYNSASKEQLRNTITGILKYVVMFMSSATSLQYAVQQCYVDATEALQFWDTGAALYIGSMEGPEVDGGKFSGQLSYSVAKDLCQEFGTCIKLAAENDDVAVAEANTQIVGALLQAVDSITAGSCSSVADALNNDILPAMIVPLIQGTIKYASFNAGLAIGTDDSSLAIGDTFAKAILPIVAEANAASAITIQSNMEFQLVTQPVSDKFVAVAGALRDALSNMATSCSDVGQFEDEPVDGNLCGPGDAGPATPAASPTDAPVRPPTSDSNLAWGRYKFQSVEAVGDADFALDVRDMWNSESPADDIYTSGNNVQQGLMNLPKIQSLSLLSAEMANAMRFDPMYSIYKYALYDDPDLDGTTSEAFTFGDDVVVEAFVDGKDNKLAAEAAVVLNVWHVIVHRLYEAYRACSSDSDIDPIPFIDSAVALWIGREQEEGSEDGGWMIYQLAEEAAFNFGFVKSEAKLNTELMNRFNELQTSADQCDTDDGKIDFYFLVQEQVQALSKVLALSFLSVIFGNSKNKVELYAVAILPQVVACDDDIGNALEEFFVQNFSTDLITTDVQDQLVTFLRCLRITSDDLDAGETADSSLAELLTSLQTRMKTYDQLSRYTPLAGYQTHSDVSEVARLDLDALLIRIMLETEAYEAASDIFKYGRNAQWGGLRYWSFQSMLNKAMVGKSDMYQIYTEYWNTETFADNTMNDIFNESGVYVNTPRKERALVGFRVLQGLVSYIGIYSSMGDAYNKCVEGDKNAVFEWDSAVALFVGSGEGILAGGRKTVGGSFLYALSEEICSEFGLCESLTGETVENEKFLFAMASGRDAVKEENCEFVRRLTRDGVAPQLSNLIVQGFLAFAIQSADGSAGASFDSSFVGAHAYANILLPLVNKVDSSIATLIGGAYGKLDGASTGLPIDTLIQSLAPTLRGMGIDCKDVDFPQYSLCLDNGSGTDGVVGNVPDQAPIADTPTELGDGLYVTTTFVQDRANIAKDIVEITEALTTNNVNLAKVIYQDGKNSYIYDDKGDFVDLRSLKGFSTEETQEMLDDPMFSMFVYSLRNADGLFLSRDARMYADSIVGNIFDAASNADTKMLPVEAILSLNLWMHLAHSLYETLLHCKNKEIKDEDGIHSMDIAVAYWIGDGQISGSGENGHLLYAMAERMGEVFNMETGGQSRTNTNILKLVNEAKQEISLPGACSESPSSYLHLTRMTNDILSLMAVPLIQSLIHALREDDTARVQLFAQAVVPLTAGCGPGPFEYLKEKLLTSFNGAVEVEDIINAIRETYPCLGLTCDDIGVHTSEMTDESKQCKDPNTMTSMAGYNPASDVGEFSQLDLDIRQLDILLEMKAYAAAENLYNYGKHTGGVDVGGLSLFQLASSQERKIVPEYDKFVRYYGKEYADPSLYADHIIRSAFENAGGQWSDEQRRIIVLKSAQVMVMYFGALQYIYNAVSECQASANGFSDEWDRGAALLIGSLEGTARNGTQNGYMFYDLMQEHCLAFGTCSINEKLISLLYTGRGAAQSNSCSFIRKVADDIAKLLQIPIIQGALHAATFLSESTDDSDLLRAEGYVYSHAILPLVASADSGASQTIKEYLGFSPPSSPRRTASQVFSAFAEAYPEMNIDCKLIGTINGNDPCNGVEYDDGISNLVWIIGGSILGVCMLCFCFLIRRRRQEQTSKLPENNPRFMRPVTGELNHSMDLLEKAFSPSRITPHTSTESIALKEDMYNDASPGEDDDFEEVRALKSSMESRHVRGDII